MKIPKIKTDIKINIFSALIFILIILVSLRSPGDPDLGWHLRNGEDILKFGAPTGDIYSHTMFGYPWISHEWLTDVLLYLISNQQFGLVILSVLFAFIVFGAYFISARVSKIRVESTLITVLIAALVAMPIVGIRPQMITLLGLAITLWILFHWRDSKNKKIIYWLVPLMLIWVNLHGGFAAGLVLIAVFGGIELIKYLFKRYNLFKIATKTITLSQFWQLVSVGAVSLLITFINPYTWRVYDELFKTVFNDVVKQGIMEWVPVDFSSPGSYNLIIYFSLIIILLLFSWRKVDSTKIWIGAIFFIIAISSWRNMPLFSLVTLPLLAEMIDKLAPKGLYYYIRSIWAILLAVILIGYVGLDRVNTIVPLSTNPELFGFIHRYPYGAVEYIKENNLTGNMFNEYNWGGYLLWKLPTKKVFIDGRMAIWKTKDQNLFDEYLQLPNNPDVATQILDKYNVNWVLLYRDRIFKNYFVTRNDEWELVFSDYLSLIFQRKNNLIN